MKYLRHRVKKKKKKGIYLKFKCNWLSKFVCLLLACLLLLNLVALVSTAVSNPVLCGITFLTVSNSKKKKNACPKNHYGESLKSLKIKNTGFFIMVLSLSDSKTFWNHSVIPKKFPPVLKSSLSRSC